VGYVGLPSLNLKRGAVICDIFSWLSSGMLSTGLSCGMLSFFGLSSEMSSSVGLSSWMLFRGCPSVMLLFGFLSLAGLSSRMISEVYHLECFAGGLSYGM